jgi:2-amino-4-hydroxy-6-hydroxymethyldihydropteridine diphosphokinase
MGKFITTYFLTGTNIGDRGAHLRRAAKLIEQDIGKIDQKSAFYETEPWGLADQAMFLNQAIAVKTELEPLEILKKIKEIEAEMGRERLEKYGPRVIDVDLLFYGDQIIDEPDLKVPHPEIPNRNFVLVPLMEIAGEMLHPTLQIAIEDLYMLSKDPLEVVILDEKP